MDLGQRTPAQHRNPVNYPHWSAFLGSPNTRRCSWESLILNSSPMLDAWHLKKKTSVNKTPQWEKKRPTFRCKTSSSRRRFACFDSFSFFSCRKEIPKGQKGCQKWPFWFRQNHTRSKKAIIWNVSPTEGKLGYGRLLETLPRFSQYLSLSLVITAYNILRNHAMPHIIVNFLEQSCKKDIYI